MKTSVTRIAAMCIVALALVAAWDPLAFASSDFRIGNFGTDDPVSGEEASIAVCRLFLGPRGDVNDGEFLLRITDVGPNPDGTLELRGQVRTDSDGSIRLVADDAAAQDFYEQILKNKLHIEAAEFELRRLLVHVGTADADFSNTTITCGVRMLGFLRPDQNQSGQGAAPAGGPVSLIFGGSGSLIEGIEEPPAAEPATAAAVGAPRQVGQCTRPNFAPRPEFCDTSGGTCLVTFKNYKWWTQYNYFSPPASPPTGQNSGDSNAQNSWSPRNVTVDAEGLHLAVQEQDVLTPGVGSCCTRRWAAAEAVTALNLDDSLAKLGYGTYLVAARVKTAASWDAMDPNVAFGVFTYERVGTGDTKNANRELDLAEVSRWGRRDGEACPARPNPPLCDGNAQFTYQYWEADKKPIVGGGEVLPNLHRYTVLGTNEITLVMVWPGAQQQVTFRQYRGLHTLASLPACPSEDCVEWKFPADRNPWVPADGCQQFHLNLWMGNYARASNGFNPPPASRQEVVVTNFEYDPNKLTP
jgi:hypothetical protein